MRRRHLVAAAVALVLLAGCDVQTATAPRGDLTLYASFDDAQDLTRGHFVQFSNVVVGSVEALELDGYQARVRIGIEDGRSIPVGTRALIRRTSLLGEHFVDLVPPETFDPVKGPFLEDDDELAETATQLDVEQLAERALAVVGAVGGDELGSVVQAGSEALGGRGATLNQAIAQTTDIVATLDDQQAAIITTIDSLAALGAEVAPSSDDLAALIDELSVATATVTANRDRLVVTVDTLVDLARITTQEVFEPHAARIVELLRQANPLLGALAARTDALTELIDNIVQFNDRLPDVISNGQVLIQAWLDPTYVLGGGGGIPDITDPVGVITDLLNGIL